MKKTATSLTFLLLAAHAGAVTLLSDSFDTTSSGFVTNWTEIGTDLWGGVGVENTQNGSAQVYLQTGDPANGWAGIYRDLGVTGTAGETITISFDFIGAAGSPYNGVFTASLWDGTPGGTLLGSLVPTNPAASAISPQSFNVVLSSNTSANLFVQFLAADNTSTGAFEQARLDNVLVTAVPEPAAALLGGIGLLGLLRRRRHKA
jgi:MYXO-CTERM domain-containing protein